MLPYVPATTNQDFFPYLTRAENYAEAIDKAFCFRLAILRMRLSEIKRRLRASVFEATAGNSAKATATDGVAATLAYVAGVDVYAVAVEDAAAKVSASDRVGRLMSELLALCEVTFR
eukprot:jgi/Tetstr1/459084/TSEL_004534.t1